MTEDPKTERSRAAGIFLGRIFLGRIFLGRIGDPWWARPALWCVLVLSTVLNTWALSINAWANTYYSATVLGMTRSWKAFCFGALDAGSFITVDKPPLALWVQALSARIFGFNSWSVLLPQAIAGVLTVWVVHHVVRRGFGHAAATVAALVLALTPIAVVMARHNNPDALLVLLLSLALWAASNAIRSGKLTPLVWSAVATGLAFNVKMLQAYFVLPVIAVVYLLASRLRWPRKLLNLGVATVVLAAVSASWMVAVDLTPTSARPYVGGSTNNTVSDLLFGYNGFGRIFGQNRISSPGMMGGSMRGGPGQPPGGVGRPVPPPHGMGMPGGGRPGGGPGMDGGGWTRLVSGEVADQISWLFPLAAFGIVAVLVLLWRRPRTDPQRADFLLWAGTLLTTAVVFSFASGIWHAYYTVALGAPLAAVAGMGVVAAVRLARSSGWWGLLLPVSFAATGFWCYRLLGESRNFLPWLAPSIAVLTAIAVPAMAMVSFFPPQRRKRHARLITAASLAGLIAVLSGPAAYAFTPLSSAVSATFPSAGPSGRGGPGGGGPGGGGVPGQGRMTAGNPTRDGRNPNNGPQDGRDGARDGNRPGKTAEPSDQMVRYLAEHHDGQTWIVAVVGAMVAAPIILDTGQPVMAIGGYNGNDAAPTVDQLRQYVRSGQLRYVWTNGSAGVSGMGGSGEDIDTNVVDESMSWVTANCVVVTPTEYGGPAPESTRNGDGQATTQLYDCAQVR